MAKLLDHRGNPIDTGALRMQIVEEELSRAGGIMGLGSDHPSVGLTPERLASLLREAETGDPGRYFALAEEMEEKDPHYLSVLGTRKRQVAQLPITVEAASEDKADEAAAELVREVIGGFDDDTLFDMLDAAGKGLSLTEIIWKMDSRRWVPERFDWVDPRMIDFDDTTRSIPMLKTLGGKTALPPWKFINVSLKAKSGIPVRGGIARAIGWIYLFKNFDIKDWVRFGEAYGQPLRLGKFHAGATEAEKRSLLRSIAQLGSDAAAIVPQAMAVEFIEAKSQGSAADLYERMAKYFDQLTSKAVLGQTATTDAIAGGHAVGREHDKVREDIEKADAGTLARALMKELARPIVDLNLGPPASGRYPKIIIARPDPENADLIIRAAKELVPFGLRVSQAQIRRVTGMGDPDEGDELLTAPSAAPQDAGIDPSQERAQKRVQTPGVPSLASRRAQHGPQCPYSPLRGVEAADDPLQIALARAEGADRDQIDALADQLLRETEEAESAMLDRLAGLVNDRSITSIEELGRRLLALEPGLDRGQLSGALAQAMELADMLGRSEIADGI